MATMIESPLERLTEAQVDELGRAFDAIHDDLLSLAKILENIEIGHNVRHGQWDWMNDPQISSSTWELRLDRRGVEALPRG